MNEGESFFFLISTVVFYTRRHTWGLLPTSRSGTTIHMIIIIGMEYMNIIGIE